jgi:hypothetical protein
MQQLAVQSHFSKIMNEEKMVEMVNIFFILLVFDVG